MYHPNKGYYQEHIQGAGGCGILLNFFLFKQGSSHFFNNRADLGEEGTKQIGGHCKFLSIVIICEFKWPRIWEYAIVILKLKVHSPIKPTLY